MTIKAFLKNNINDLNRRQRFETKDFFEIIFKSILAFLKMFIKMPFEWRKFKGKPDQKFLSIFLPLIFLGLGLSFSRKFESAFKNIPIPWMADLIGLFLVLAWIPILLTIVGYFSFGRRHRKKLYCQYKKQGGGVIHFNQSEYEKAAEALKKWKTMDYDAAIRAYGQRIVDLLFLAFSLDLNKGQINRIVSIKSIEKEIDAFELGEEDDE